MGTRVLIVGGGDAERAQLKGWLTAVGVWSVADVADVAGIGNPPIPTDLALIDETVPLPAAFEAFTADDGPTVPALVLVSQGHDSLALRALEAGAYDFLVKEELDPVILRIAIRTALRGRDLFESIRRGPGEFRGLFDASPDAILLVRLADGVIRLANPAATTLLQASMGRLVGRTLADVGVPALLADGPIVLGATRRHEVQLVVGGADVPASLATRVVDWGGERSVLVILHDATERAAVETMRRDLTAMFSHDIKNPLGGILGLVEMLRDDDVTEAERIEYLDMIEASAHNAVTLAVNFVDADRIERSQLVLDRKPVSIASIVDHAVSHQRSAARSKNVALVLDLDRDGDRASVDEPLFDRIIANLLSNAIKYTPEGGTVEISTARDGNEVVLGVSDDGPGIPPEERPHLFERYRQPGERARNSSGLGLFIVSTIADAHEATIDVGASPSGGSAFTVRLPAAP